MNNNWISTKDRLPEADASQAFDVDDKLCESTSRVLICTDEGLVCVARYCFNDGKWTADNIDADWFDSDEVLFWQPLPTIPDSIPVIYIVYYKNYKSNFTCNEAAFLTEQEAIDYINKHSTQNSVDAKYEYECLKLRSDSTILAMILGNYIKE